MDSQTDDLCWRTDVIYSWRQTDLMAKILANFTIHLTFRQKFRQKWEFGAMNVDIERDDDGQSNA